VYDTKLVHQVLAAVAGCTLVLAVVAGVSVGASASAQSGGEVPPAASAPLAPSAPSQDVTAPVSPITAAAPPAVAPPVTAPKVTAPPTTRAPRPAAAPVTTTPAPAVPAPVTVVTAARRTPPEVEVQAAISGLVQRVGGILRMMRPTPTQIAQAGDQVCTSFDSGQTFAQVKATGLSMIPPSITVSPATADWAVRTAVSMFCPDHTSKLV
jgi:hypothetical protein